MDVSCGRKSNQKTVTVYRCMRKKNKEKKEGKLSAKDVKILLFYFRVCERKTNTNEITKGIDYIVDEIRFVFILRTKCVCVCLTSTQQKQQQQRQQQ